MIANELPLRIGGVMRCCVATLEACTEDVQPGHVLRCKYCDRGLLLAEDGIWEWWEGEKTNV